MCCGGTVLIYIEPIMPKKNLYIFGAGHTGFALANYASALDFDIYIFDDRPEYIQPINIEGVNKMEIGYSEVLPTLPFNENTYVVIMTYEHSYDRDILSYCINQPHAYIGMIGSQRKIELTKKMFIEGKIASEEKLNAVDMPMGIRIKAEGPHEIAISILAKLINIKNDK
jgi:xanthine dehydrogenase accessory factor